VHTYKGSRGHLSTGHTIDSVVDKYDGDILAPGAGVYYLGGTDSGQVTVSLIGERNEMRTTPLDGGGHRWGTPVSRFQAIEVEIVVSNHRATDRSHTHYPFPDVQLIDDLSDKTVHNAVTTARAKM